MTKFDEMYKEFENTNNVCAFSDKYKADGVGTRFLLIRSLDKSDLKAIIEKYSDKGASGNFKELIHLAYDSEVTVKQLLEYIESKRDELIHSREEELKGLSKVLENFPIVNCGVRNDKVDDIVKSFVRDKSMKSMNDLMEELEGGVLPRVKQYCLWSYYNQTSNDIIELYLLKNKKVIPTLRKIHDIDFFLKVENDIVPFDLKFTHISDEFFNLASKGIEESSLKNDSFEVVNIGDSELQKVRSVYNEYKKANKDKGLLAASKLSKSEMIEKLENSEDKEILSKVKKLKEEHENFVPVTAEDLKKLEWWNYKYQGERLFCNNNRLFVFIAYNNLFTDGRVLKGKTKEIGKQINELLDNLKTIDIHTIKYHYDKEDSLVGDYTALSLSTIYTE